MTNTEGLEAMVTVPLPRGDCLVGSAMDAEQQPGGQAHGVFAGAVLGVGGVHLANKLSNDKRTKGWNGRWKCIYEGEEMCVLDVKDDGAGNLDISNWQVSTAPRRRKTPRSFEPSRYIFVFI